MKLFRVFSLFLLAVSLPAFGSSVKTFSAGKLFPGDGTTASGSFNSDSLAEKCRDCFRTFGGNSIFESANLTDGRMSGLSFSEESFLGARFADEFHGRFSGENHKHNGCGEDSGCHSVPEGGARITYLILSGIAVLGGILISRKLRRTAPTAQSI